MGAPYEKILRSVLDDPTLTDAEARLIGHLATRPPGWIVIPSVVAKDIKRNERYWVRPTLRLLAARGIITAVRDRGERAQFSSVTYLVNREELTAPDVGHNGRSEPATVKQSTVPPAETSGEQENPQVGPRAASQSTVPPAETQNPRSDRGLSDGARSDRARSDNRRERTDFELRTDKETRTDEDLKPQDHGDLPVAGAKTGKRGTRIPDDFREQLLADPGAAAWFRESCPDVDGRLALDEFIDYWKGVSGQRGCKLDWIATWRNRMRKKQEDATRFRGRGANRLDQARTVAMKNRKDGKPSAAMAAFTGKTPTEESRREITS